MPATPSHPLRDVVLVGGGHTHVQVLRRFAMEPPDDVRLTVVLDVPIAVYSGMVPGFVAGQYRKDELEIDVVPLARRARARVVLSPAVSIDAEARRIELADRPPIRYDLASVDIGSTVAGLDLPGVREHAIPTRPIGRFVERVDEIVARAAEAGDGPFRVVVVGAGAGGVELAFALRHRLAEVAGELSVTLLQDAEHILPSYSDRLRRRVLDAASAASIRVLTGRRVVAADPGGIDLEDGERLAVDALVWVTGAVSGPIFGRSGLPTDERGFVRTRPTLQVEGHDDLFAVGDCATLVEHPETPKAGVYAVRQGPYLIDNLSAALSGRRLRRYRPQSDFLTLINLADGGAIGGKWGLAAAGRCVMWLKDRIDRKFMRRFQVLDAAGRPTPEHPPMPGMEMLCGGCAAKVGQSVLERALARVGTGAADPSVVLGLDRPDDAAAVRMPGGDTLVSSVDLFKAFTDDPYLVGRVAAVNAVSDVFAKGVAPRWALAIVALPEELSDDDAEEALFQALSGVRATLDPLAVTLTGGHTTTAAELMVGLVVDGVADAAHPPLPLGGLKPGQRLVLTKALGTGVIFHADMQGLAAGPWVAAALDAMVRDHRRAAAIARAAGATAMTDVTGFGLAGHLAEMTRASGVAAVVEVVALPALLGAVELLAGGQRSTFHAVNARARRGLAIRPEAAAHPSVELVFDPQTSGGVLFGVAADRVEETIARLVEAGDKDAAEIGRVVDPRPDGAPIELI